MKQFALLILALVGLAQLAVPASMIWKREQTLRHGRVWKLETAPLDPADPFRGRYVALSFKAEEFDWPESAAVRGVGEAYLRLKNGADGFAVVAHITKEPMSGDDVIKVDRAWYYERKQRVNFPFAQLWLDENIAPRADKAYAEHNRRGTPARAYVTVRIRDGDAALEELFIEGKPLREYLRDAAN